MLRSFFLFSLLLTISFNSFSQFQIGHTTITFNDSARTGGFGSGGGTGRQIQTEIYYPATTAGQNVALANGSFPVISFGHGFVMGWDSYLNIWSSLVPEGYIIMFPRTEGSFSPSHADFGKDLALVIERMKTLGNASASLFYNHVDSTSAIMGHSMGGGSSFLAGANNPNITTMVTMAAANTNPSSAQSAINVTVPNLVIAGQNDCVAPKTQHQDSMYNNLGSSCKVELIVKGGGHCYFANTNTNCSFGEGTCTPQPTITRTQQQNATMDFTKLWLKYFLKQDCNAWNSFNDSLAASNRVSYVSSCGITCTTTGIKNDELNKITVSPNPANNVLVISNLIKAKSLKVFNSIGECVLNEVQITNDVISIRVNYLKPGLYFVKVMGMNGGITTVKFIKE